ncbi:hypothetical protein N9D31_04295, partial [Oligoflexaceae bacterium]|nr:hypothetical protein [Oligoflexaceae bacterium]
LGDGFFPIESYQRLGGLWSIGSDSHIQLNPFEDLRWLEYGQRLQQRMRVRLCDSDGNNAGYLYNSALKGGITATAGQFNGEFVEGQKLEGTLIDENHSNLVGKATEQILPSLIFSSGSDAVKDQFVNGLEISEQNAKMLEQEYRSSIERLYRRIS